MSNGMRTCMSSLGLEKKTKLGKTKDTQMGGAWVRKSLVRYVETRFWRILSHMEKYSSFSCVPASKRLYSFHYYLVLKVYPLGNRKFILEMKARLELEKPIRESLQW